MNTDKALQETVNEKKELFLKELNNLSLWQARHILKCVEEELESKSVIHSDLSVFS